MTSTHRPDVEPQASAPAAGRRIVDDAYLDEVRTRIPHLLKSLTPRIVEYNSPFLATAEDAHDHLPGLITDQLHETIIAMTDEQLPTGEPILRGFEKRDHVFLIDPTAACRRRLREEAAASATS